MGIGGCGWTGNCAFAGGGGGGASGWLPAAGVKLFGAFRTTDPGGAPVTVTSGVDRPRPSLLAEEGGCCCWDDIAG